MSGLQQAVEGRPDLVVLDLGLPDLDGAELLRMLRAVSAVPVIVATARDDDGSVVSALDAGADDYVLKPFRTDQLEARIRAVLRRATAGADARTGVDHRRRAHRRPPRPPGQLRRRRGRPLPQGVRPAGPPGRPGRRRGLPARAAHRRVAAA